MKNYLLNLPLLLALDKVQRRLRRHAIDGAGLVGESDSIAFVGNEDDLGTEGGADELRAGLGRDRLQQAGHCGTVLGVQVGVNLVEDHHGARLGLLDGKDEAQSTQTWREMVSELIRIDLGEAPDNTCRTGTYSFAHH